MATAMERPRRSRASSANPSGASSGDESPAPGRSSVRTSERTSSRRAEGASEGEGQSEGSSRPSRTRARSQSIPGEGASSGGEAHSQPSRKRARSAVGATPAQDITGTDGYVYYLAFLDELLADPRVEGFHLPVHELWEEEAIPDYGDVIAKPMDLGTVRNNLVNARRYVRTGKEGPYLDEESVLADIRLTFSNCMEYNSPESEVFDLAKTLLEGVEARVAPRVAERSSDKEIARERRRQKDRERRQRQKEELARQKAVKREKDAARRARQKAQREAAAKRKEAGEESESEEEEEEESEEEMEVEEEVLDKNARRRKAARSKSQENRREKPVPKAAPKPPPKPAPKPAPKPTQQKVISRARDKKTTAKINAALRQLEAEDELASSPSPVANEEEELSSSEGDQPVAQEVVFRFVSTTGLDKKRGRKSVAVMQLEARHIELTDRRRDLVEHREVVKSRKGVEMSEEEKKALCDEVQVLDFVRMKTVVDIIAKGMGRSDIRDEVMVDIAVERVDNGVLREIQLFLENPAMMLGVDAIGDIEKELADIETQLVSLRFTSGTGGGVKGAAAPKANKRRRR